MDYAQCGVYEIRDTSTDKRYVGSSNNVVRRLKEHKSCLRNNKHPNRHLQFAWNKYGELSIIKDFLPKPEVMKFL